MEGAPAPVAVEDSRRWLELLVSVTGKPPAGAAVPMSTLPCVSRNWPMDAFVTDRAAVLTIAVTLVSCNGTVNPAGSVTDSVLLP